LLAQIIQAALVGVFTTGLRQKAPGIRSALPSLDIAKLEEEMADGDVDLALMTPSDAPAVGMGRIRIPAIAVDLCDFTRNRSRRP